MRITRVSVERTCSICERTLLMGERAVRFSPNGGEDYVDVCPLCQDDGDRERLDQGGLADDADDPRRAPADALLARRRCSAFQEPRPARRSRREPILRRLSEPELAIVEAADLFNASQYRRTIGGIAKSLGEPRVSIVPLSGVNPDVVVTVAWEISWYQYRVTPDSAQPVRLAERGHDPAELEGIVRRVERAPRRRRPARPGHCASLISALR